MAIRLRLVRVEEEESVTFRWIALCATESDSKEGDIYLDDVQHHGLSTKFALDFNSEGGYDIPYDSCVYDAMRQDKIRDAKEEHKKWQELHEYRLAFLEECKELIDDEYYRFKRDDNWEIVLALEYTDNTWSFERIGTIEDIVIPSDIQLGDELGEHIEL